MATSAEITKLSQRLWQPKQVATEVAKRLIGPESAPQILPETPNEILKMMSVQQDAARALAASPDTAQSLATMSAAGTPFPAPLHAIQAAVSRFSDSVSAIPAKSPVSVTPSLLAQLARSNPLAHDRFMAIPTAARNQILAAGTPQDLTLFLPVEGSQPELAAADRIDRQGPHEFAEVFQSTQLPDGAASVVGKRLIGNEWYNFCTTTTNSPNSPASTWIAPQRLLNSRNPAQEKDLSAQRVTGDVQRLVEGPWRPYLKGAGLAQKPHTFDIRHSDKDGVKSVLATLNTITGTLQTIQSVTKGIQKGLEFLGMAGSLGQLGGYISIFNGMKLPGSPGELITALITGKGINPSKAAKPLTADQTGSGKNGVLVTKGGAAAAAMGDGMLAKAEAEKKKAEEQAQRDAAHETGGGTDKHEQTRELNSAEKKKVDDAIRSIENSKFGKTEEGRRVTEVLREKQRNGDIERVLNDPAGSAHYHPTGNKGTEAGHDHGGKIHIEDDYLDSPNPHKLEGNLVHEATHALDDRDFQEKQKSIENEVRAYENEALYLSETDPGSSRVKDYYAAKNRDDFKEAVRKYGDGLYGENVDGRYPGSTSPRVPEPTPPDRSNYGNNKLSDVEYQVDKMGYDGKKREYDLQQEIEKNRDREREREREFERKREEEFRRNHLKPPKLSDSDIIEQF